MGFFEDLLEGFFTVIGWIAEGIRQIFKAIAAVIEFIGKKILPILALIIGGTVLIIGLIAIFAPALATTIVNYIIFIVPAALASLKDLIVGGARTIVHQGKVIASLIATILDKIHFDVILQLHEIAWIFSEKYRETMSEVFRAMGEVSQQLFGYGLALQLILNTTRNLVFMSTTAAGMDYTGSQMVWLETMSDILSKFNEKTDIYADDPYQFFIDLEQWVDENKVDLSGALNAAQWQFIDSLAQTTEDIANQTQQNENNINVGLDRIGKIEGLNLDARLNLFQHGFDGFVRNDYAPTQYEQNRSIEQHRAELEANRIHIGKIDTEINRPGDMMLEAEHLPEPDRSEQLEKMQDATTKPYQEEETDLSEDQEAVEQENEQTQTEQEKELEESKPPLPTEPAVYETPQVPAYPKKSTWFVGEF